MNKKLKKALEASFAAPLPRKKDQFLRSLPYPKITYSEFLISQLFYIRKRVWLLSFGILIMAWAISQNNAASLNGDTLWMIAALLPFLALATLMEVYRSAFYRMAEIEGSCRFSLPQILMARLSILGTGNFSLLILLLLLINGVSPYSVLQLIFYLLFPYLLTCTLCLLILNRMKSQETMYTCATTACLVSVSNIVLSNLVEIIYSPSYLSYWIAFSALTLLIVGIQVHTLFKQMEDKPWNLCLME